MKTVPSLDKYEVIHRNTSDDVVTFIVSELDEILKDPKVPSSLQKCDDSYKGRVTTAAVHALKAKTLLFAASPLFNKSNDRTKWEKAATAGKAAIDFAEANGHELFADYGKPPVITKRIASVDDPLVYSPETAGIAALESAILDFKKAEVLLANKKVWDIANTGRGSYNSVQGMLVKLYSLRAAYGTIKAEDYQNAIAAFGKIDQPITTIEWVKYGDNFDGHTENNKESLFEYQAGDAPSGDPIWLDNDFGGNIGRQGACVVFFNIGGGVFWTWNQPLIPTQKLVNKFERNDPRFIECMDSVSIYSKKYDRDLMWFAGSYKTGFVFHKYMRPGIFNNRVDHTKGLKYQPRDTYGKNGYGAAATTTNPWILRFADVKLLVAEASK